ncbi:phosphoserine phosphatase [Fistulifera solaris]|uniref:phosphoserine phosphatase n=1 Tax=Fistulifera solaris TaxID=1519565 RepID=A0A1Z5JXY0_FISSO|nr:phosphoserine phosphatase [Fistulifera solaris]|eukprot:GAX18621.1 phosphoserine phosphatase [Fistulifera solaris]
MIAPTILRRSSRTLLSSTFLVSSCQKSLYSSRLMSTSASTILQSLPHADTFIGKDITGAIDNLMKADCVCFDVDSTVVDEEGIDVLADHLGLGEAVAALTKQAMEGGLPFQDALAQRLELLKPSKQSIEECLEAHPLRLTPGVAEFIGELHFQNKHVYLVSGGFRIMIEPVANILNISVRDNIVANTILFDQDGQYAGFDPNEPTSRDMGKPKALQRIQEAGGYKTMIMIGDGATDAQAKPPAASFIGFGGVARREKVVQLSDWFVTDFSLLTKVVREAAK